MVKSKIKTSWIRIIFMLTMLTYSVIHIGSWASHPPDVDPVNFVIALDHFDISTDRPHPPGYPLYVGLAKAASYLTGHTYAYQLVNLTMLLTASLCLFLLSNNYGRPEVGLATAVLLITHPLSLSATIVQESYFSDAFFGCLIVSWLLINASKFNKQLIGLSFIFLALGLFRIVSCAELGLVAVACIYITNPTNGIKKAFLTTSIIIACTVIAYLVTIWLAGGYATYSAATTRVMGAAFAEKSILAGAPLKAHALMLVRLAVWFTLFSLPTLIATGYFLHKDKKVLLNNMRSKELLIVTLCWMLPALGLYSLLYFLKPTYLLILLPPILLVFSTLLFHFFQKQYKKFAWALVILMASTQLLFFYYAPASLPKPLYRLTHTYFNVKDSSMSELVKVTSNESSVNTLLIWVDHPDLTIYAMRVLAWKGQVGLIDASDRKNLSIISDGILPIASLNPVTMHFGSGVDISKVDKVLVIDNEFNQPTYTVYSTQDFLGELLFSNTKSFNSTPTN